jgi:hypothetical protein
VELPRAPPHDYRGFPDFLLSRVCVSADAATLFTCVGVLGLLKSFDAFDATDLEVLSFLDMVHSPVKIAKVPLDSKSDSAYRTFAK